MLTPRPYQQSGHDNVFNLIDQGQRRICATAPTGAGKSISLSMDIQEGIRRGWRVSLYTHRSVLIPQLSKMLAQQGIQHGIRASGHEPDLNQNVQVSMWQTEAARCLSKRPRWNLHDANLVLVDEAHGYTSSTTQQIIEHHYSRGAAVVGYTATPVDLWHLFDSLVIITRNSELQACGAHLPCLEFAPDEPDAKGIRRASNGEFVEGDVEKRMTVPVVFGRVLKHYQALNPFRLPGILFGPSVDGSKYFCDEFLGAGIAAAHIDAKQIYFGRDPKSGSPIIQPSSQKNRQILFDRVRAGDIKMLCNRFVLTEGVDLPELHFCSLATMFGSVKMFLQAAGRLLRSHPSMDHVVLCDHGGSIWRHGSVNEDRDWEVGKNSKEIYADRVQRMERGETELAGITCPKCSYVRLSGPVCHNCGHAHVRSSRTVIQQDGTLKRIDGCPIKKKRQVTDAVKAWNEMYWPSYKSKNAHAMTFNQLWARFKNKHPEMHPHINKDLHGRERLAVVDPATAQIVNLPMHPPVGDAYTWALKVRDVPSHQLLK